jgi:hypothetical protein
MLIESAASGQRRREARPLRRDSFPFSQSPFFFLLSQKKRPEKKNRLFFRSFALNDVLFDLPVWVGHASLWNTLLWIDSLAKGEMVVGRRRTDKESPRREGWWQLGLTSG